tara:strand:+ start:6761 stop:7402 length:642 start_codon:yes stop_codon:yes gene_type:complete
MTDTLYNYYRNVAYREPDIMRMLREETETMPMARMQISPEQGQFLAMLVALTGAKKILEVGTFTGYSSLWMASSLPEDGKITACDVNEEWTNVARRYWKEAGLAEKIDLQLAPAVETLDALLEDGCAGSYDMAFIDADKTNYDAYYERALLLLRKGGLIAVDNCLWGGDVADPDNEEPSTLALRALNKKIHQDERVTQHLLPLGDGVMLAHKR